MRTAFHTCWTWKFTHQVHHFLKVKEGRGKGSDGKFMSFIGLVREEEEGIVSVIGTACRRRTFRQRERGPELGPLGA
jgi:hypothetical protein